MHISLVSSEEPATLQAIHPKQCSTVKVSLFALGLIFIIAGAVATGILYTYAGYYAYASSVAGLILGIIFITIGSRLTASSPMRSSIEQSQNQEIQSFVNWRPEISEQDDPFGIRLVGFSMIESDEELRKAKQKVEIHFQNVEESSMTPRERKAMAIMLGMACGDSIGAPYEILPFKKEGYKESQKNNRFELKVGQWTDDTSMGLCLADVLIRNKKFDGIQLMWAFLDWWDHGYNNTFTGDETRNSVGLGSNIELSFKEFKTLIQKEGSAKLTRQTSGRYATRAGDAFTNGNGSLMRLGPVAIVAKTEKEALELAWEQSKVTHQGDEAAACCQLMAFFLFHALHSTTIDTTTRKNEIFKKLENFNCKIPSVNGLAKNKKGIKNPQTGKDENWNWQDVDFSFNAARIIGCAGSYAMDGLAMALHCVFTTSTFEEAVLKAATRGGDADTVGAIAGQLAGAIYGVDAIPKIWVSQVQQWDRGGEIATRGYLLCHVDP